MIKGIDLKTNPHYTPKKSTEQGIEKMTLNEATKLLPVDSTWSCIFGSYGESGCNEYWTAPNGDKWVLHNEPAPFGNVHNWNARKV